MRKMIAYPFTAALLLLGGCSKLDTPDKTENSCDMCHTTPLNLTAVHRLHLANPAMANFPFRDTAAAANYAVLAGNGDSTFKFMADTSFKFSRSATRDAAEHYRQTRLLNYGIKCSDCHKGLDESFTRNSDDNHRNGKKDASFNVDALLAKHYDGGDTAHFDATAPSMSFDGTTCNNIACHGGGRKDLQGVTWNKTASVNDTMTCTSCHNTTNHKVGVTCDKCHSDVTLDGGKTIHNFRKHLNDTINYGILKF